MRRLCERPGCAELAALAFGFDADRLLVWLAPRDADADPLRAGALCGRHADAMVVPRGWTLDDRRQPTPQLFRSPALVADVPPGPARRPRPPAPERHGEQLALDPAAVPPADARTVAAVTGTSAGGGDPDETTAIPWSPDFDLDDDLGGVLGAGSPLLARAFRGADRPR